RVERLGRSERERALPVGRGVDLRAPLDPQPEAPRDGEPDGVQGIDVDVADLSHVELGSCVLYRATRARGREVASAASRGASEARGAPWRPAAGDAPCGADLRAIVPRGETRSDERHLLRGPRPPRMARA